MENLLFFNYIYCYRRMLKECYFWSKWLYFATWNKERTLVFVHNCQQNWNTFYLHWVSKCFQECRSFLQSIVTSFLRGKCFNNLIVAARGIRSIIFSDKISSEIPQKLTRGNIGFSKKVWLVVGFFNFLT